MARTFMIHTALHWDGQGSDAVALWPFAVRHAVWLHNRLPNSVTGLSPMELLTGIRSDHRDLLRTHVWGCPVYVLDPKLQDGQKIPKWNRRARQGQFLGFSDEHSSLVANVRHLISGYVSPQFHVVFDDRFHTVHGDGKADTITDTICDLLWENDREIYAEDEHGPDGSLIYTPPPLDTVWLDEEAYEIDKIVCLNNIAVMSIVFVLRSKECLLLLILHLVVNIPSSWMIFRWSMMTIPLVMILQMLLLSSLNQRENGLIMVQIMV